MTTFVVRQELNQLSEKVFGASSKWKTIQDKCLNSPAYSKYRVYTGETHDNLRKKNEQGESAKILVFRAPTDDELLLAMKQIMEVREFGKCSDDNAIKLVVSKFLNKNLLNPVRLFVAEKEKEEFDKSFSALSEDNQKLVKGLVVTYPDARFLTISAAKFVNVLLSAINNSESFEKELKEIEQFPKGKPEEKKG